ncbi:trigger factor [Aplysia californica]|uniref:Trigger factor n=1 Tax=Aplysia californica TaxID=6500 RepID=A0ABM1A9R0_APLCA|nr:trigger factor [Aplysia californica]
MIWPLVLFLLTLGTGAERHSGSGHAQWSSDNEAPSAPLILTLRRSSREHEEHPSRAHEALEAPTVWKTHTRLSDDTSLLKIAGVDDRWSRLLDLGQPSLGADDDGNDRDDGDDDGYYVDDDDIVDSVRSIDDDDDDDDDGGDDRDDGDAEESEAAEPLSG